MDSKPSTSSTWSASPPKTRKLLSLGHLSLVEKQHILNMYKLSALKGPGTKVRMIVCEIAEALGVAKSNIFRVVKQYRENGKIRSPKDIGGQPGAVENFDEFVKTSVRQIVHSFFFKNEMPTLDKILKEVNSRPDL